MFKKYLEKIGLLDLIAHADEFKLNNFIGEAFAAEFPDLSEREINKLYVYDVPWVSPDGLSCILDKKADKPYSLAETFGLNRHSGLSRISYRSNKTDSGRTLFARMTDWEKLKRHPQTKRLWRLNKIVEKIYELTKVEWFGVYRKVNKKDLDSRLRGNDKKERGNDKDVELVLVKEAYRGVFSRAEFPLTKEFAKKSNNSKVGLSGKAIVIQDIAAYTGAYYECDNDVNSEFCLPILSLSSRGKAERSHEISHSVRNDIIGIIDAEAFAKNHYTDERLLQIAKVAYDLGQRNLGISF